MCIVKEKGTGLVIIKIKMVDNRMFPLRFDETEELSLLSKEENTSQLWHLRYGHVNFAGLKLLKERNMVDGLPQ